MQPGVWGDLTGMHGAPAISRYERRVDRPAGLAFRLVRAGEVVATALVLADAAHRESRFGYIPLDREKTRRVVEQALAEDRRHLIAVAEVRGRLEGFVFASAREYLYGSGVVIVRINTIYTSQKLRKSLLGGRAAVGLFRAVGRWAKGIGARQTLLHTTSGIGVERMGKAVGRMGFEAMGGAYVSKVK